MGVGEEEIVLIVTNFMHTKQFYAHEEGLERDEVEEDEGNNEGGNQTCSTPLWKNVTKLEGGRGGIITKFICSHGCQDGKPFSNSYNYVRTRL